MRQEDLVRALQDPGFYPHRPERGEHVQTHMSHVFLAGPYVYKLKKAVRFSFLDFSTPDLRHHFCEEEVRLSRRLSPSVYLGVVPITRDAGGPLRLGASGDVVDHVVWMRRLPGDRILVNLVTRGAAVSLHMMDALAARLAAFHGSASQGSEVSVHADPERLASRWGEVLSSAAPFAGVLLAREDHDILTDLGPGFIRAHETLLRARQRAGRIREGHGDLHAEHVCSVDAPVDAEGELPPLEPGIYVFDCIEFSQPLRCNDVAYEIAFLAMDLDSLRPDLARRLVAAYVVAAHDPDVRLLLPFYGCHLASVRGMVEGLKSTEAEVDPADREAAAARARRHFALAVRYAWTTDGPAVIACTGLSGTGKTTLAVELARTTGFTLLGTDTLRKQRAGLAPEAPGRAAYGASLYTDERAMPVYAQRAQWPPSISIGPGDALVVTDVQRDFLPGGALAVAHGDEVIVPMNRYLAEWRARGLPIILTRDWHPPDHCSFQARGGPWPPHCVAGTEGAAFDPLLAAPASAIVISKATERDREAYSAFEGTDLESRLRAAHVRRVFVGGFATEYCVLATVRDALVHGFGAVVLVDAIRAIEAHPGDGCRAEEEMVRLGATRVQQLPGS